MPRLEAPITGWVRSLRSTPVARAGPLRPTTGTGIPGGRGTGLPRGIASTERHPGDIGHDLAAASPRMVVSSVLTVKPHRPGDVLIVSDLDGTLLRPDETISERTAGVVNAYVAAGGLFTYATARSFTTANRAVRVLTLNLPVITYGGAVTVSPDGRVVAGVATLPASVVERAIQISRDDPAVQPIIFAMLAGKDRVCWIPGRATLASEALSTGVRTTHASGLSRTGRNSTAPRRSTSRSSAI